MNVHERLSAIAKKRPKLKSLVQQLMKGRMTPAWFKAYRAINTPQSGKQLLLRTYLGQPQMVSNADEQYGSEISLTRLFESILARHPELLRTPLHDWDIKFLIQRIPPTIVEQLGLPRGSGNVFLRDWLFSDKLPAYYADHPATKKLKQQCLFNASKAKQYFLDGPKDNRSLMLYFDAPCEALWASNIIYYLYFFITQYFPSTQESAQRKIPVRLSRKLGIQSNCVPGLLAVIDLLYLGSYSALDELALAKTHPNIVTVIQYLKQDQFKKERAAFAWVGFLTPKYAVLLHKNRKQRIVRSRFHTGFYFNMEYLLMSESKLGSIKHLYQHVDIARYNDLAKQHCLDHIDDGRARMKRLVSARPEIAEGLELRSLMNIMIYLDMLIQADQIEGGYDSKFNYIKALPPVAKYQFGLYRPTQAKTGKAVKTSKQPLRKRKKHAHHTKENRLVEKLLF